VLGLQDQSRAANPTLTSQLGPRRPSGDPSMSGDAHQAPSGHGQDPGTTPHRPSGLSYLPGVRPFG
jgi:hypothetical protein